MHLEDRKVACSDVESDWLAEGYVGVKRSASWLGDHYAKVTRGGLDEIGS
jgi:hypothetical protein